MVFIALRSVADGVVATELDETAQRPRMSVVRPADLPAWVAAREGERPRWVWNDTARWYPPLLAAGTRVDRALDLRLCRRILRASTSTAATDLASAPQDDWDAPAPTATGPSNALFDLEPATAESDPVIELRRQRVAVEAATAPGKLEPAARRRERRCSGRRRDAVRRAAVAARAARADPHRRAGSPSGRRVARRAWRPCSPRCVPPSTTRP